MRFISKHLLLSSLLVAGWMVVHAQSNGSAAQRIGLAVVDNKSTYEIESEQNNYENQLRLRQPNGQYKLTAGMLNDGANPIVLHRVDDKGGDIECARINLETSVTAPVSGYIGEINFLASGTPSSNTTVTNSMLPANWGTDNSSLIWQTSGYGTITGREGLTFTIPEGYSNATVQLVVGVGDNVRYGYFSYNYNNTGWRILTTQVSANQTYSLRTLTGVNSGDVISIYGGRNSNGSYYTTQSPDIERIGFMYYPETLVPSIEVTPTISHKDGESWSDETTIGSRQTYTPNDTVNMYGLGIVTDIFSESTADNNHPENYTYKTLYHANIMLPGSGSTGEDFYASADFTSATTSDPASSTFNGSGNWLFSGTNIYSPSAGRCCYMQYYGAMLFTMPDNFMGNSVQVKVTTSTGDDGAGDVYVNGIGHTFTPGSSYIWTVPVTANGVIEFKPNGETYSADITKIEFMSGNGSSLNSPGYILDAKNGADGMQERTMPIATSKITRNSEKEVTIK